MTYTTKSNHVLLPTLVPRTGEHHVSTMTKMIVIGNSGSGKTWLSKRIATAYGILPITLDSIFWKPGGYNSKRTDLEIETDLKQIQESNSWVVEGVFGHLADRLVSFADSLIYLDLPWDECRKNLMDRGSESSSQLDPKTAEKNFQSLLSWASEYEMRDSKASKKYHSFLYDNFPGDRHRIYNRDEADRLFKKISANLSAARDVQKAARP